MADGMAAAGALGTLLAPATGGLSELIPVALGAVEGITSIIKKGKANKTLNSIPAEDPSQRSFLNDIMLQRKQLMTGTAFQQPLSDINTELADTISGISKASGGAGRVAIAGMSRAFSQAGKNYGNLFQAGLGQQNYLTTLADSLEQRIAMRKFALKQAKYSQLLAEAAQNKQDASGNILGAIAGKGFKFNPRARTNTNPTMQPGMIPGTTPNPGLNTSGTTGFEDVPPWITDNSIQLPPSTAWEN